MRYQFCLFDISIGLFLAFLVLVAVLVLLIRSGLAYSVWSLLWSCLFGLVSFMVFLIRSWSRFYTYVSSIVLSLSLAYSVLVLHIQSCSWSCLFSLYLAYSVCSWSCLLIFCIDYAVLVLILVLRIQSLFQHLAYYISNI